MNEITIHGHTGKAPTIRHTRNGSPVVNFSVAVSSGYHDRARNKWISNPTVWHDVVVFNDLANNVYDTFMDCENAGKGLLVTVTGKFADDSYTREFRDEDIRITKLKLEATDVAISLVRATATVTKKPRVTTEDASTPSTAITAALNPAV